MRKPYRQILVLALVMLGIGALALTRSAHARRNSNQTVILVPEEDRFAPFAVTIKAGGSVRWINGDSDSHTIVSDDFFNTTGQNRHVDIELPGTEDNGGQPGSVTLNFGKPGVFVYYCRFHSHLDGQHQPVAPGPEGGIDDAGNFGTPMMGVVTVLPGNG
jgi:plastocyanin